MNYWLNIHWPSLKRDKPDLSSPDPDFHYWVFLPDGRQGAGDDLNKGDYIFIYETKWGRARTDGEKYSPGRQGVIALSIAKTAIYPEAHGREIYADGTWIDWKWRARAIPERYGFCSRKNLCSALGYSTNWTLRGFGDLNSGLKKLTYKEYQEILKFFK